MKTLEFIRRAISLPFVAVYLLISLTFMWLKMCFFYLKNGGEFVTYYLGNEPTRMRELYRKLDELLTHKQQTNDKG